MQLAARIMLLGVGLMAAVAAGRSEALRISGQPAGVLRANSGPDPVPGALIPRALAEGIQPFSTLPGSKLVDLPEHLASGSALVLTYSHRMQPLMAWASCLTPGGCDVFFFLYDCPTCRHYDGGLRALLAAEGFRPTGCRARFQLTDDGFAHRMAIYSKVFEGEFRLIVPQHEWGVFGVADRLACETIANPGACTAAGSGTSSQQCVWNSNAQVCKLKQCPTPAGPFDQGPTCKVCPADELP